ncbi:MAG: ATP-binding protein [Anaerolineales bacterium]
MDYDKLTEQRLGEPSRSIQERVEAARERQRARFEGLKLQINADMRPVDVRTFCPLDTESTALVRSAIRRLHFSARAFHRILKLARTIADLVGSEQIDPPHVAEALQCRPRREG